MMRETRWTLMRGQTQEFESRTNGMSWWVVVDDEADALERVSRYAADPSGTPHIYRARLSADAVQGEHPDYDNAYAGTEGDDWLAERLASDGADYLVHTEGALTCVGIRCDRLRDVLSDWEALASDDPDDWQPKKPRKNIPQPLDI